VKKLAMVLSMMIALIALAGCDEQNGPVAPKAKPTAATKSWQFETRSAYDSIYVDKVEVEGKFFYVFRRSTQDGGLVVVPAEPELEKSR
jgi:hypothetical protein